MSNYKKINYTYIFYVASAIVSFWYWHVDEHYQISEFASYKLGITPLENLAWEFKAQIRSGILPFITYSISWIMIKLNIFHPFIAEAICRILAALLFVFSYLKLLDYFELNLDESQKIIFRKFSIFFWVLPIIMVRFSSESVSSSLFWLGFYYFNINALRLKKTKLIFVGLIWGISFYIRMHLAIMIGIFFLWVIIFKRNRILDFGFIFIGFLISTCLEFIVNYWLYNEWIWSPYLYFKANVIDGIANQFGEMPFYFYFTELIKNSILPIGIFIIIGVLVYVWKNKTNLFSWLICGFIIIHSLFAHKEYRFLFPIFPLLIPLSIIGYQSLKKFKWKALCFKLIYIINLILLPTCFIIHSFNPYNYLRLYPLTKSTKTIHYDMPDPYALGKRFVNVKPYFWKDKSCKMIELDSNTNISEVKIFITTKDYGETFIFKNKNFSRSFQTIPKSINQLIPESIKSTIDYLYIYQ